MWTGGGGMSSAASRTTSDGGGNQTADAEVGRTQRFRLATAVRQRFDQVFPTHWSSLLAQVAVGSFIVLVLSGIYLEFFFDPSMADTVYNGPYENLHGVGMTHAFQSTLAITFEHRGGLFIRQLHNWASSLFIASLLASLVVKFFIGAFRKPRHTVWMVSVGLLFVAVMGAFTGLLLPDDMLSGTSLRMTSGYILSIPVVGTWLHWMVFGGEFPGTQVLPLMHVAHLLIPVAIVGLFVLRARLLRKHGYPQAAGEGRTETNVVGLRGRAYAIRSAAMYAVTIGVLGVMAAVFQVNPVWQYGPADPADVSAGSTSPWFFGWVDGAVRLMPAWEIHLGNYTIPPWFWPSMVFLPLSFIAFAVYPLVEARFTRDTAEHHLVQRPRDVPVRTSLGMLVATFYACLQLAAATDVIAFTFNLSADAVYWGARIAIFVLPGCAYWVTYRICLGLQRSDRTVLEHGVETGNIRRMPNGAFIEVHHPLGGVDEHDHPIPLPYKGTPVPKRMNQLKAAH